MTTILSCAHRGDSSRFRENTLLSIKSAIDAGAEIVEIDVRLSKDGQVLVLHDPTLERLWGVSTPIALCTWEDAKKLGAGMEKIPRLLDVLSLFVGSASTLMIDMEGPEPAQAAYAVAASGPLDPAQITWCGDLDGMRTIRSHSQSARIWMPWNESAAPKRADIESLNPEFINLHYSYVTRERVAEIHALNCKVSIWTVDDAATMR